MLVLSKFTLFFIMLSSLLLYLFTNIKLIGEGSPALVVLAFSVLLGGFLIVLEIVLKKSIYVKNAYAGTIRTASRFTSGHSAEVDSDS